jgi:hypothetical protein
LPIPQVLPRKRRSFLLTTTIVLASSTVGCALDLDPPEKQSAPEPDLPLLKGCLPLTDRLDALDGRISSASLPGSGATLFANGASVGGATSPRAFAISGSEACPRDGEALDLPLVDLSELQGDLTARPLSVLSIEDSGETYLYFSADEPGGFASRGIGVARFDRTSGHFEEPALLWTTDRPSYGSGAAHAGGFIYVFGGLPARFLAADVYFARVPADEVQNFAAYEYWIGGGDFDSDPDLAAPLLEGGTAPNVAYDARQDRWLMAYSTPLAREITLRSGLGVTGPWSAPLVIGECDLPEIDPDSFCGDVTLLPELFGATDSGETEIALAQTVASFERPASATAQDFWTRLIRVPWPEALP